jgi:hypothetical protein
MLVMVVVNCFLFFVALDLELLAVGTILELTQFETQLSQLS